MAWRFVKGLDEDGVEDVLTLPVAASKAANRSAFGP
jgi:hypothetical protein